MSINIQVEHWGQSVPIIKSMKALHPFVISGSYFVSGTIYWKRQVRLSIHWCPTIIIINHPVLCVRQTFSIRTITCRLYKYLFCAGIKKTNTLHSMQKETFVTNHWLKRNKEVILVPTNLQEAYEAWLRACIEEAFQSVTELFRFHLCIDQLLDQVPHVPLYRRWLLAWQVQKIGQEVSTFFFGIVRWLLYLEKGLKQLLWRDIRITYILVMCPFYIVRICIVCSHNERQIWIDSRKRRDQNHNLNNWLLLDLCPAIWLFDY